MTSFIGIPTIDCNEHWPLPQLKTNNNVKIPDINITINETRMNMIQQVNLLENDGSYGIDLFSSLLCMFQSGGYANAFFPNMPFNSL